MCIGTIISNRREIEVDGEINIVDATSIIALHAGWYILPVE
jgi:hypothetical protein